MATRYITLDTLEDESDEILAASLYNDRIITVSMGNTECTATTVTTATANPKQQQQQQQKQKFQQQPKPKWQQQQQ